MPLVIPNSTTTDKFTDNVFAGNDVFAAGYFTVANNSAAVQLFSGKYGQASPVVELFLPPGTYPLKGGANLPIAGLAFKSFVPGEVAQVFGTLFYPGETTIEAASQFESTVSASGSVVPPGQGMQLIESVTVAVNGFVTFSGISPNFKHLKILWIGTTSEVTEQDLSIRFNGDGGANYSQEFMQTFDGASSTGGTTGDTQTRVGILTKTADGVSAGEITIPRYSISSLNKIAFGNLAQRGTSRRVGLYGGKWNNNSVISSIRLSGAAAGNIAAGSVFDLFGIA